MRAYRSVLRFFDRIIAAICGILPHKLQRLIHVHHRMLTYAFMGCINTAIDYGLYSLLYYIIGAPVYLAQFVGLLSGSTNGYLLNSNITFQEGKGRTRGQYFQYVGVDIVLAVLSGAFMKFVEGRVQIPMIFIKVIVSIVVLFIHYFVYKKLVFRIGREDES
jgi:putative flippase GtrA